VTPLRVAIAVLGVGLLGWWSMERLFGPAVVVTQVDTGGLLQTVVTTGRVVTRHRIRIGSEIVGTVVQVSRDEGDAVAAGEVLIVLDDATRQAALAQAEAVLRQAAIRVERVVEFDRPDAEAALREARATLAQAEREAERRSELLARNLASTEERDRAALEVERAQAQVARAELRTRSLAVAGSETRLAEQALADARHGRDLAAADLARTRIASPAAGQVLRRLAEPGDTVQAGATLLVVSPTGPLEIEATVDEISLQGLAVGQPARVEADAYPGMQLQAELSHIAPQVDADRGSVLLRFLLTDPPDFLRQDLTVSVDVQLGRRERVLAVPNEALRDLAGDRARVWVVAESRVAERDVQLGLRGLTHSEVVSGLAAGDRVLAHDAAVSIGQRVRSSRR